MNQAILRLLTCFIPNKKLRHIIVTKYGIRACNIYSGKEVCVGEKSCEIIKEYFSSNKPCFIGRFGLSEFKTLYTYLYKKSRYSNHLKNLMCSIYPNKIENYDRFAKELLETAKNADVLAAWQNADECKVCKEHLQNIKHYISCQDLMPLNYENPWMQILQDKKVLVINPFADTIQKQYKKRELLFKNPKVLPEFELLTLKPPYITKENISNQPFESWFKARDFIKEQISEIDFDIALIGAGPFAMFLGDFCIFFGKKAITTCGDTQLLFGIIGQRWLDYYPEIAALMNEHWIRPQPNERPEGYKKVENGCYW